MNLINTYIDRDIQPRLKIGAAGDKYEQEADRIADKVMRMPDNQIRQQPMDEEEEQLQMKQQIPGVQKMCPRCQERYRQGKPLICPECSNKLQMKPALQSRAETHNYASPQIRSQLNAAKGQGSNLRDGIQREMSQKIGADFSDVKVHTDSKSAEMTDSLGAKAFTFGNDIYFNQHQFSPDTSRGQHLLIHELTHVIQQGHAGSNRIQRQALPNPKCNGIEYHPDKYCCNNGKLVLQSPIQNLEECPDRVPNKDRMNEYDGCSVPWWLTIGQDKENPAGGTDTQFSDTSIHGTKPQSFIPDLPCDVHDKCYQTCWPSHLWEQRWRECDARLFEGASRVCSNSNETLLTRLMCHRAVAKARRLLPLGSWSAFVERQKEYCNCCPGPSKPVKDKAELLTNTENVRFVTDPNHWDDDNYLISRLPKDTKVEFLEDGAGESFNDTDKIYQWWKVQVNGETGWVMQVLLDEVTTTP